ncbi:MAG: glutamate synthase [Rickettsiales bacterium]|nr:glutamate synthase [Rickettsiales bacterium]|tara:strand:+ start:93 stop:2030 length:1938 start_codon:yes stop_codon:yes gene_type:complete
MPTPDLYPIPLATLADRLFHEIENGESIYYLPRRDWWLPDPSRDLHRKHFGKSIATPVGPAAGPHTQLAQNLVLSWLAGGRFMELKTVQLDDQLVIPRPCIHVPHIGYNVEWSQELRIPESALEYIKGWYLIHVLASEHGPGLWPGAECLFDLSVGYDLDGIRSEPVRRYIETLRDASGVLAALRSELPPHLRHWADVSCPPCVSDTVTISTFHGCPAHEIEAIATQLMHWGLHTVVKLNPTLLGYQRARHMLDEMGYDYIQLEAQDFDNDLQWDQLMDMLPRLEALADTAGLGFGVKFSNTLICRSEEAPFGDQACYLSGPPLFVLSSTLAAEFREATRPELPITFSAGIDAKNLPAAISSGLMPVTSCSDLLKGRGYGRLTKQVRALEREMKLRDCGDLDTYLTGAANSPLEGAQRQLREMVDAAVADPRYRRERNQKPPNKINSDLELLDCITCDKCVPVCPNAANFTVALPTGHHEGALLRWKDQHIEMEPGAPLLIAKKHQIGNTGDLCNLCGECDTWCPEDGGPYIVKPTVFLTEQSFADHPHRDAFLLSPERDQISWRRHGETIRYRRRDEQRAVLETPAGTLELLDDQPLSSLGQGEVQLADIITMRLYLSALSEAGSSIWLPPLPETNPLEAGREP